jgi:hypothetical protein
MDMKKESIAQEFGYTPKNGNVIKGVIDFNEDGTLSVKIDSTFTVVSGALQMEHKEGKGTCYNLLTGNETQSLSMYVPDLTNDIYVYLADHNNLSYPITYFNVDYDKYDQVMKWLNN